MDPLTLIILGGLACAIFGTLAYSTVRNWLAQHRELGKLATLIKTDLANGNARVLANVLNREHRVVASESWEASALDSELQQVFRNSNTAYEFSL